MAEHHEHQGHTHADPAVRAIVTPWWEQRHELRTGSAWDVPFPPRAGETARVTREREGDGPDARERWRACLIRPRTISAYIEVESREGPIAVLENLYNHTV